MRDARRMGSTERRPELSQQSRRSPVIERSPLQLVPQAHPLDVLDNEERIPIRQLADVEDSDDAWMVNASQGPHLLFETQFEQPVLVPAGAYDVRTTGRESTVSSAR